MIVEVSPHAMEREKKKTIRHRNLNTRPQEQRSGVLATELRCRGAAARRLQRRLVALRSLIACREIFTLYAVSEWLGYVQNGREIITRKLNELHFKSNSSYISSIKSELRTPKVWAFNM